MMKHRWKNEKMLINCGNINQDISGCCPDSRHEASFACRGFNMVKWNPGGGYFCRPLQASRLIWGLCARLRTSGNRDFHRLPSSSIRFFQFGMRRVRWNKELVQFSRYDPWHATVYFGICSSISVKNSIRVGPIGLTRSLSLERFRAFWHTFLNRSRTWCEASRRSWMVWSQHSGRCLERLTGRNGWEAWDGLWMTWFHASCKIGVYETRGSIELFHHEQLRKEAIRNKCSWKRWPYQQSSFLEWVFVPLSCAGRSCSGMFWQVLYCCFKRNLKSDVKVAQLVGYVGLHPSPRWQGCFMLPSYKTSRNK